MNKVVMHNVRASFVNVFNPKGFPGQEPKYSLMLLIPKDHKDLGELKAKILDAAKDKFPKLAITNKLPGSLRNPLRDGDEKYEDTEREEYRGCFFVNCSSKQRPGVFNRDKTRLTEEDGVIYSGCYVNVSLSAYGYDVSGNKGVALGLNGVQFKRDGDRLGGAGRVEDDFDEELELDDDDEDEDFAG